MPTGSIVKSLRVLGDINRLRMLLLLAREELSVAELQEILGMGQSSISTHLAQLKHAGLVEDRRAGKNIWYSAKTDGEVLPGLLAVLQHAPQELPEARHDQDGVLPGREAALVPGLEEREAPAVAVGDAVLDRLQRQAAALPDFS